MGGDIDFEHVYTVFHSKINHYVSRLTWGHDAEDITQEVFEKVSRGIKDLKDKSRLSAWIYRIATNTVLDRLKSPSFKQVRASEPEDAAKNQNRDIWTRQKKVPLDQQLIRKEMSACVREHVDKLPPDYRTVIILSELEGFKNREIADILQVSLNTAKIRLYRARASLKKLLEEECDFYHSEQAILACDRKPPLIKLKKSD